MMLPLNSCGAGRISARSTPSSGNKVAIMLIELEEWKREWGRENLIFASEHGALLPPLAREFLISYGLPRCIIHENPLEGDWEEYVSAEISFEFLSEPLD